MFEKVPPESVGIPSLEIKKYIEYLNNNSFSIHSLLLMKGDKIYTEAYWKPFHKDFCHRQYSQTKSFVGVAIGLLIGDGRLSLDDKIVDLFCEKIDDVNALPEGIEGQTVRDMLTMSTVGDAESWFASSDADRTHHYFSKRNKKRRPGALWHYDSAGSQVLSALVEKVSGMSLLDFLRKRLFSYMGSFENAEILKTRNGDSWGDSAMICTARDMATFAYLLMNRGRWGDKQLIDEDYVKAAVSAVKDNSEDYFGSVFGHGYGYQIWQAPQGGFAFVGMAAQLTVVLPEKELIFVINSDTQGRGDAYDVIVNGYFSYIADRMSDEPLPENYDAYAELEGLIGTLELFALKGKAEMGLKEQINGKVYSCEDNSCGIEKFSFIFGDNEGEFIYTNEQGDKVIPFGINKNVFGKFPQLGYSNNVGGERTTDGFMYNDAVSLRFTGDNKLQMKVQIVDRYFGNFLATFAFVGNDAAVRFVTSAENFLGEYKGEFIAHIKQK